MNTNQKNDLILKNISFSYYEKNYNKIILDNFNCKIKKGKFTSIIGPSGTGKSSLLKLIAGLIEPEKGEIKFENQTLIKVINQITLIQQNPSLMPWLNVYDNITLANSNNKKIEKTKFSNKPICIIIGPEGDFSEHERQEILSFKGVQALKINDNILRSETAVISAISIINYVIN